MTEEILARANKLQADIKELREHLSSIEELKRLVPTYKDITLNVKGVACLDLNERDTLEVLKYLERNAQGELYKKEQEFINL